MLTRTTPVAPIYTLQDTHAGGTTLVVCALLALVIGLGAGWRWFSRWYWAGEPADEDLQAAETGAPDPAASLPTSPPR